MRKRNRDYVTLAVDGSFDRVDSVGCATPKEEPSSAEVVYQPMSIREECDIPSLNAGGSEVRALVVARYRTARAVVPALAEAGFAACVAYAEDKRFESHVKGACATVSLGHAAAPALYANAYAVLEASRSAEARALFLCDEARLLSDDVDFLARARARDVLVYRMLGEGPAVLGWVPCGADEVASDDGAWRTCPHCGLTFPEKQVVAAHCVCPSCAGYLRMSSRERIDEVLDGGSFREWSAHVSQPDPLRFPGYGEKLAAQQQKTGLDEAVRTGEGSLAGLRVAVGVMESSFFMGSMGSVVGEKITRMIERATDEHLPAVVFTASGGARMQEGLVSLMQMAKVSCALSRHAEAGLPYISVLTDPTTGGVTASFAMQGDVVLAEPGALIGFAGQRVIRDTIKQELPAGFQTAEFALEHGLIDAIVPRERLRETLAHILALHAPSQTAFEPGNRERIVSYAAVCSNLARNAGAYPEVVFDDPTSFDRALATAANGLHMPQKIIAKAAVRLSRTHVAELGYRMSRGVAAEERMHRRLCSSAFPLMCDAESGDSLVHARGIVVAEPHNRAWESVQLARNTHRPTAMSYVAGCVDGFIELHGDRSFGDDAAMVCGLGWVKGTPVTVVAQEKGSDLKERIRRNFGCPQPEGYRKSLRLMKQAEKFKRPVVCFVDTQGAFCGMEAEERGQGNALADNLLALAGLRVPVISVLVGEGGSGGALALALADRVAMQEHAVYSVLSPEGFASILWKDRTRAPEAAAVMKMSAREAREMGIVDAVLSEGPLPAHENPQAAIDEVKAYIVESLETLSLLSPEALVGKRYERFGKF